MGRRPGPPWSGLVRYDRLRVQYGWKRVCRVVAATFFRGKREREALYGFVACHAPAESHVSLRLDGPMAVLRSGFEGLYYCSAAEGDPWKTPEHHEVVYTGPCAIRARGKADSQSD